jgi:hypothetical protein
MLAVICAQVGIAQCINHEVFHSLLELEQLCSAFECHSFLLSVQACVQDAGRGFPDEKICCFLELMDLP